MRILAEISKIGVTTVQRIPGNPASLAGKALAAALAAAVLLELALRAGGALYLATQRLNSGAGFEETGVVRVLRGGESTTAGGPGSYPPQLERALNARAGRRAFSVANRGVTGTDTGKI